VYSDGALYPWFERLKDELPGLELFDAHTHTGSNDPDGYRCSAWELLDALDLAGARAVVFSMHEPDGYSQSNDRVLAEAAASDGRLVPFARLDPQHEPLAEGRRCLREGARGFKLHPRAERFGLDHPALDGVFELAEEARVPVLVHAGRGIPALGRHVVEHLDRRPGARVILGHAGVCDLGWLSRRAEEYPGLFFDTAWWSAADLTTLLAYVAPGQVLFASDAPYGTPLSAAVLVLRCALQAGLTPAQVRGIAGGQLERLVRGEEALALGPAPGPDGMRQALLLHRVETYLVAALGLLLAEHDADEQLSLARLACEVGDDAPEAPVCRSILALLDRRDAYAAGNGGKPGHRFTGLQLVITAAGLTRTPDVALPSLQDPVTVADRLPA
jgi:predicted TIM-barrel fold metal-dependent hydrolase